jgi:glycosyltransferase involved in cell wall biosynthesis
MFPGQPSISIVIPVYNAENHLRQSLAHLRASTQQPLEVIVVDDASTDRSVQVARDFGARVISAPRRQGPASARNLGAQLATGDVLYFLDADVCVYPNTLERVSRSFFEDPALDALIGSYDDDPSSQDFLSQYRNLMHCFVHQTGRREASTFWSGCGAVRREVFLQCSGFDERYHRPAIEDIELGYRMAAEGRKLILDPDLQVKHLKRWTFWNLVKTDVLDRGIPWTELILRDQQMANDLNLQLSQRVSVALVYLLLGLAAICAILLGGYFLTPLFAVLFILLGRYWMDGSTRPRSATILMTAGLFSVVALAYKYDMTGIIPPLLLSFLLLFLRHRYSQGQKSRRKWVSLTLGSFVGLSILVTLTYLPTNRWIFGLFVVLIGLVLLNNQFYLFLAAKRGRLFAVAAIPFHLLYHFYNGVSFTVGLCRWALLSMWSMDARHVPRPRE